MSKIHCDVVIVPHPLLAQRAVDASGKLTPFGTKFTLKEGEYYPHASLYMLHLRIADFERVAGLLGDIARTYAPLQLPATNYNQAEGYIDVEYAKTPAIDLLQDRAVHTLNPIRVKGETTSVDAHGVALDNFRQYGYGAIGELFRPHITFTRFRTAHTVVDAKEVLGNVKAFSGMFTSLGLFELGDDGTCVRQICEVELHE